MNTFTLRFNAAGDGIGGKTYADAVPDPLPADEILCTQAQSQNPSGWQVDTSVTPPTLVQSLSATQAAQVAAIKQGFVTATATIPFTINGVSYVMDAATSKQASDMAMVVAANNAINHPVAWTAGATVGQYAVQEVNGVFLFCMVGGTTGTTAPVPPTTFGATVTDNTVTWALYGRDLEMSDGTYTTFTPQEIVTIFQQVEVWIHLCKNQLQTLIAQIMAATTISDVEAVVWSNP